jgi:hypothetical protein
LPGALSELSIRRDEPVRRVGGRFAGDPVVGDLSARADDVVGLDRCAPVEDDQRTCVVPLRPVPDELDEPPGRDVGPERALDVPAVDDQVLAID